MLAALGACVDSSATDVQSIARHDNGGGTLANDTRFADPTGFNATTSSQGYIDLNDDFFTSYGTNGRTCGTCHRPESGWTFTPAVAQRIFDETRGLDPLFHNNDGTVSPLADQSTTRARRKASAMLLTKGLIRVGIGVPATADFDLAAVDDPYNWASASQLSLFRRPLPSMNLGDISTVMWDGRETLVDTNSPPAADSNCLRAPVGHTCFQAVNPYDLASQAQDATLGHAQAEVPGLSDDEKAEIVSFEASLSFAQVRDDRAGRLDAHGANGGPDALASFPSYFGINDTFGDYQTNAPFTSEVFDLYEAWANTDGHDNDGDDDDAHGRDAARAAVARGEAIFNSRQFTISGVGGLNGNAGLPDSFAGTCSTCHNTPEAGSHSIPLPLNIGISDASLRTPDMPLYTLRCNAVGAAHGTCTEGQTVQSTDPGRALITGSWADIGKFKGPTLRGLAARAPYFHNGSAADLGAVVDFYDTRFNIGLSHQDRRDLVAFLRTL